MERAIYNQPLKHYRKTKVWWKKTKSKLVDENIKGGTIAQAKTIKGSGGTEFENRIAIQPSTRFYEVVALAVWWASPRAVGERICSMALNSMGPPIADFFFLYMLINNKNYFTTINTTWSTIYNVTTGRMGLHSNPVALTMSLKSDPK